MVPRSYPGVTVTGISASLKAGSPEVKVSYSFSSTLYVSHDYTTTSMQDNNCCLKCEMDTYPFLSPDRIVSVGACCDSGRGLGRPLVLRDQRTVQHRPRFFLFQSANFEWQLGGRHVAAVAGCGTLSQVVRLFRLIFIYVLLHDATASFYVT